MSKLISLHPKSEYEKLRNSPRRSSSQIRRAMSSRHLSPRQEKVSKALSLSALNQAVEELPEVVPVGATGFVPWRTAEKSVEKKVKLTSRKIFNIIRIIRFIMACIQTQIVNIYHSL